MSSRGILGRKSSVPAALLLIAASLASAPRAALAARAQGGRHGTGLGIEFGEPTGLTGKFWIGGREAIDAGLAFSFNSFFLMYGDYLYHYPSAFGHQTKFISQLDPYIGGGAILFVSTDSTRSDRRLFTDTGSTAGFGVRVPLGIEWTPSGPPIGVFVELVPGIGLAPSTFGFLEGGIGARFYF